MAFIKGGTFTMGTPLSKRSRNYHEDEAPIEVTVGDFMIGRHPVTASQMCAFLNSDKVAGLDKERLYRARLIGPYRYTTVLQHEGLYFPREGAEDAPANQVTWLGAHEYCEWLSKRTGRIFRLPTEAEWEYAARGSEGRAWPWGDAAPRQSQGTRWERWRSPSNDVAVGSFPSNATPEGVEDMLAYIIGEWCVNKYAAVLSEDGANDSDADAGDLTSHRIVRGYYHRRQSRPKLSDVLMMVGGQHGGRTWTRMGFHPFDCVKEAARHGFRVVEELPESDPLQ
ncbi:MAG: formylglycine-generating enzyme family protein [bacterium]|nr:formylglycine-generating enzyme family protein [bacterium]